MSTFDSERRTLMRTAAWTMPAVAAAVALPAATASGVYVLTPNPSEQDVDGDDGTQCFSVTAVAGKTGTDTVTFTAAFTPPGMEGQNSSLYLDPAQTTATYDENTVQICIDFTAIRFASNQWYTITATYNGGTSTADALIKLS